jgi:hypothetical protein
MQVKSGYGNSKVIDVPTPREIYESLNREFGPFGRDPCPLGGLENPKVMDGLLVSWDYTTFVNPPWNKVITT